MRLFLAIDLPLELQDQITQFYLPELTSVRWSTPHQLHLTLVFIGSPGTLGLDEIIEKIAEVELKPFTLTVKDCGFFKSGILWLGLEQQAMLTQLVKSLNYKLRELGLKIEGRKFKPHITLGRCKKITPDMLQALNKATLGFSYEWQVDCFQLKSSHLRVDGAIYSTEAVFETD